jgi:formate hydrogenlyase subunit 3/multisubunit Na+/H+ antiporter MnhD subunit
MSRAILSIIIPIATALFIALVSQVKKGSGKLLSAAGILCTLGFAGYLFYRALPSSWAVMIGNWKAPFGIAFYYSPFTTGASLLALFIALVVLVNQKEKKADEFYILFLISITGVSGIIHTTDVFNMFVFIELLCLSLYALIGQEKSKSAPAAGFKYMVNGIVTGMLMLLGIGIVYSAGGTLSMVALMGSPVLKPVIGLFAGLLLLLPLLLESKQFPFNTWVPGVYGAVPYTINILVSSIAGFTGLVVVWRFTSLLFTGQGAFGAVAGKLRYILLGTGIITLLIGELSALTEKNLKKVLAFSSMGQSGLIVIGISLAATSRGAFGIGMLLVTHTLAKAALFLIAGFFIQQTNTAHWKDMTGVGRRYPYAGALFFLNAMALLGLPPLSGFWGKFYVSLELVNAGGVYFIALAALVITAVIEGIYYFRIGLTFFARGDEKKERNYSFAFVISIILISSLVIILGIIAPRIQNGTGELFRDVLEPMRVFKTVL